MAWIRVTGHDRDLVELVSVGGSDAATTTTVGDQSAGGAVVRLLPTTPAQHQPFRRRHHAILHIGTGVAMTAILPIPVVGAVGRDDRRWIIADMVWDGCDGVGGGGEAGELAENRKRNTMGGVQQYSHDVLLQKKCVRLRS